MFMCFILGVIGAMGVLSGSESVLDLFPEFKNLSNNVDKLGDQLRTQINGVDSKVSGLETRLTNHESATTGSKAYCWGSVGEIRHCEKCAIAFTKQHCDPSSALSGGSYYVPYDGVYVISWTMNAYYGRCINTAAFIGLSLQLMSYADAYDNYGYDVSSATATFVRYVWSQDFSFSAPRFCFSFALVTLWLSQNGDALTCLSCTGLEAIGCTTTTTCGAGEVCYVQKYKLPVDFTNFTMHAAYGVSWGDGYSDHYEMGCIPQSMCPRDTVTHQLTGKRSRRFFGPDLPQRSVVCRDCCSTYGCNTKNYACNSKERLINHNMECYACENTASPSSCSTTKKCRDNEVCYVQKYRNGFDQVRYDLGCAAKEVCMGGVSHTVGRRAGTKHLLCDTCCSGTDRCNYGRTC